MLGGRWGQPPRGGHRPDQRRATAEQDTSDPFAENNRAATQEKPASLLADAEKEFQRERYEQAATLYARAEQTQPGAAKEFGERWGYCRLFGVAQRINRG